ncbi:restriction endonuclease subunit S [Azovibrio restrictus]|uniref:restriction endonuclease subunit S n=1 Tax=Azovibrio restrictus TaxID=146938 RepID=UPI0026F045F6|nr:restriction endonuclease subunit S [Azovibrio restrictus]MDD3483109.1 restriction endonuclease subunit S [Azovibrio restrictus]
MEVREPSAKYLARVAFKQTELGDVPTDWNCLFVAQIVESRPNAIVGGPFGSDLVSKDYVLAGVPVIRGQNMGKGYVSGDFVFVSNQKAKQLQANLAKPGDLVFTQRGTLGQVSIVPPEPYSEYVVSQSQMKLSLNTNLVSVGYVFQYFSSPGGQRQIFDSAIQTGVPHTNLGILRSYQIPAPPTVNEQQAIATALSDADALIESLEQLLAKKRQIKQGAMQELLTAQRRLPGFEGEWEEKFLGECLLSRPDYGINAPAVEYSDKLPAYIRITDISDDGCFCPAPLVSVAHPLASEYYLEVGDLVFARTGASVGKSYRYKAADGVLAYAGFLIRVRPDKSKLDPEFLAYLVQTKLYWDWVRLMSMRSGQPGINGNEFRQFPVQLPRLAEQTAIAQVLSDMDADIAAVETRLTKARAIKQGMMQELLTGRIRLV